MEEPQNGWIEKLKNLFHHPLAPIGAAAVAFIGLIFTALAEDIAVRFMNWLIEHPVIIWCIAVVGAVVVSAAVALAVYYGQKKAHFAQRIFIACPSGLLTLAAALFLCYTVIPIPLPAPEPDPEPNLEPQLEYVDGVEVSLYAGYVDGELSKDSMTAYEFSRPESLTVCDGVVYVTDDSNTGDGISLLELDYGYVTPILLDNYKAKIVHTCQNNVYVLAAVENQDGVQFACVLLVRGSDYREVMEPLPLTDDFGVQEQTIADFAVTDDGKCLWLIVGDLSENENKFAVRKMIHAYDDQQKDFYIYSGEELELPTMASQDKQPRMIADSSDNLYVSLPESNLIRVKEHDAVAFRDFAGVEGNTDFNDRGVATFHSPTALATDSQYLYVWDSGTIRRILTGNGAARNVKTLAGNIEENGTALDRYEKTAAGQDAILTQSGGSSASIAVLQDGTVLLSDPTKAVIYKIQAD